MLYINYPHSFFNCPVDSLVDFFYDFSIVLCDVILKVYHDQRAVFHNINLPNLMFV